MNKTELAYAKTFLTANGRVVLEHLRKITIERFLGPNATDAELRALEGQRNLVHHIEQLIQRGQSNAEI